MPLGDDPLVIPGGACKEIHQVAEHLDFSEDDHGTFIVLHFRQEVGWVARPRLRVAITREIYEKYLENSN